MGSNHQRTLEQIFSDPVPANIRFRDIESLVKSLGGEVVERGGSKVMFVLNQVKWWLDRPHPGKDAKRYQVRDLRTFFENAGVTPR